jgi:ABC-type phosphate/phosphonate transport system substrate-binding protein
VIANARMYSVSPDAAKLWRALLAAVIGRAGLDIRLLEHAEPAPIDELWRRPDMAAVFMCGLPFSRAHPHPLLVAAPVPSPAEFGGLPQYWSELVVREDSGMRTMEDTFGGRLALTVPDSQSGCLAALHYLMTAAHRFPPYREVITPKVTPLGAVSAVIDGAAEVAPIDSFALRLLRKYRPDLTSQLRIVARTMSTPIPPLVASAAAPVGSDAELEILRAAFLDAHRIPAVAPLMRDLLLQKFVYPDPAAYDALRLNFEIATRYWRDHPLAAKVHPAFAFGRA